MRSSMSVRTILGATLAFEPVDPVCIRLGLERGGDVDQERADVEDCDGDQERIDQDLSGGNELSIEEQVQDGKLSQRNDQQFFELYQEERYKDQLRFYDKAQKEFTAAQTEAVIGSIILIFLSGIAGIVASSVSIHWLKLLFLLLAAIFPIFSTALAAYGALYSFGHQAKLYQDTITNLLRASALAPVPEDNLTESEFAHKLNDYVREVEKTFLKEQGQWGQLAEHMRPAET